MASFQNDQELANRTSANHESANSENRTEDASEDHDEKATSINHLEKPEPNTALTSKNVHAVKGDESDGRVPMTPKRYIAMIILAMSYVGEFLPPLCI